MTHPHTSLVPLFGDHQVTVIEPAADLPPFDKVAEWSKAFQQWLAEFTSPNTRKAYERAWRDILEYTGKLPWAIQSADIRDWIQDLEQRPLDRAVVKGLKKKGPRQDRFGYAPSTIGQYLAAVSSFYTFTQERYLIIESDGRERPLHQGHNPARAIRRPKSRELGQKSPYLPIDELFSLLRAINQDTLQGLRDYALFIGYVFTGRRNSEWRTIQWSDLEILGSRVNYLYSGKGKQDRKFELAPPVWNAIKKYLAAADRLDAMNDDDYIFTALTDTATRLPNVSSLTWDAQAQPLSMGHCNNLLKKYARRAGLDAARLNVHVLRHSAAMMLDHLGYDIKYISRHLDHSSVDMTMRYLDHMKGRQDESWRQVAAALKIDLMQPQEQDT